MSSMVLSLHGGYVSGDMLVFTQHSFLEMHQVSYAPVVCYFVLSDILFMVIFIYLLNDIWAISSSSL